MKKTTIFASLLLSLTLALSGHEKEIETKADYDFEIADENNLADWKYDWNVVGIGAGNPNFDTGHLRMENINQATANYALYHTNKFNEFRLDMHANLNLPSPSDLGITEDVVDYANLYLTFFIDFADAKAVDNVAMAACPWTMNKGWLSVCFERIQGGSHIQMLINETFDNNGGARYFLQGDNPGEGSVMANVDWCDNQYHWFTITAESVHYVNPERPRPKEAGTIISVYIDGIKQTSYFQTNAYYSNTHQEDEVIPFDTQKGYIGLWASSGYNASHLTSNTGVCVDIDKLQITSYDDVEDKEKALPYPRCEKPSFNLDPITNFSPAASYEAGEEFEIKMDELFTYDGDKEVTYSATCKGQPIGQFKRGYFVWTPEDAGMYTIQFMATDGELSAVNDVRFRVESSEIDIPEQNSSGDNKPEDESASTTPAPTNSDENGNKEPEKKGCKGSVAGSTLLVVLLSSILGLFIALKRRLVK